VGLQAGGRAGEMQQPAGQDQQHRHGAEHALLHEGVHEEVLAVPGQVIPVRAEEPMGAALLEAAVATSGRSWASVSSMSSRSMDVGEVVPRVNTVVRGRPPTVARPGS
jgi:hypothetical protein